MMPPTVDAKVNPNVPRYAPPRRGADAMDAAPAGGAFEDALFMVAVRPVDEANDDDTLPLFQGVMPKTSVIASDARGGLAARAPSPGVELLTKDRVSLALFSRDGALSAEALVDAFVRIRDAHRDEPRARANALRAWLKSMHDVKRVFSLALFDESGRVFAAWTPRSAPLSFGHARDGSAVVVAARVGARTLVGPNVGPNVTLAHLPAGRFVYGHGYLKPFEFTDMWASALANRAGAGAARLTDCSYAAPRSPAAAGASPDAPPLDDHAPLSMEEKKKWRWERTGSRAEQASSWIRKKETVETPRPSPPATPPRARLVAPTKTKASSPPLSPAAPAFVAARAAKKARTEAFAVNVLAADLATAAARRLDFAVGAVAHFAFRGGLARVNRYDARADKRFLTLLLLRVTLAPETVRRAAAAAAEARGEARRAALGEHFQALAVSSLVKNQEHDLRGGLEEDARTDERLARGGAAFGASVVAAAKKTARAATRKSAAKEEERRKAIPARVRGVAGSTNSSVVVCDLKTGVCCVGDQCFIG